MSFSLHRLYVTTRVRRVTPFVTFPFTSVLPSGSERSDFLHTVTSVLPFTGDLYTHTHILSFYHHRRFYLPTSGSLVVPCTDLLGTFSGPFRTLPVPKIIILLSVFPKTKLKERNTVNNQKTLLNNISLAEFRCIYITECQDLRSSGCSSTVVPIEKDFQDSLLDRTRREDRRPSESVRTRRGRIVP